MFGNTQVIARSVADGLAPRMQVDLMEVGVAPTALDGDVDLLVVGGSGHLGSMVAASEEGNGPATCADPSPSCVPITYALNGRRTSRHQTPTSRWRRRRPRGRTPRTTRPWAAGSRRSAMSFTARTWLNPACMLCMVSLRAHRP